jgi:hypothetical protein
MASKAGCYSHFAQLNMLSKRVNNTFVGLLRTHYACERRIVLHTPFRLKVSILREFKERRAEFMACSPVNCHVSLYALSSHFIIHAKCASQAKARTSTLTHGMSSKLYGRLLE